jgi:hypothetical protein
MATLDFTPLFRSSIGFDQLPGLLSGALQRDDSGYPRTTSRRSAKTDTVSYWPLQVSAWMTSKSCRSRLSQNASYEVTLIFAASISFAERNCRNFQHRRSVDSPNPEQSHRVRSTACTALSISSA